MTFSKSITLIFFIVGFISGFSQTYTWIGTGGDNDWHNISNWDLNSIPTSTNPVVIPENATVNILNDNAFAYTLLLSPNATLTIERNLTFTQLLTITPDAHFIWKNGILSGGAIENDGEITIETLVFKDMYNITLNNRNRISITNSSTIRLFNTTTINNFISGEIIINSNGGIIEQSGGNASLNNSGLITKVNAGSPGAFYMIFDMNNYGIIDVGDNQTFLFLVTSENFNNFDEGIMQGEGIYDITATFTNTGTLSPGDDGSIEKIEVINNFSLAPPGKFNIDLAGINSDEYDTIDVFGGPILQGEIDVNLTFEPIVNDEFIILTSNFTINTCDFPAQVMAPFNGFDYTFDIICNLNDVTLKLVDITLSLNDFNNENINFQLIPNPAEPNSHLVFPENPNTNNTFISIYNSIGQELMNFKASNARSLDMFNLSSGMYIAKLKGEEGILASTKFIVP